jgi:hypothetical protein
VDGWAGSDGLPGYFGYPGPELAEWITTQSSIPQVVLTATSRFAQWAASQWLDSWTSCGPEAASLPDLAGPGGTHVLADGAVRDDP